MAKQAESRRTTIYDLAKLAGSSPSAVSAVLNGNWRKRRISAALAERITRIADEQGYSLNMQASALRREGSHLIGMIVPKYDNRYFGSIVEGFEQMARARGLFPIVTCTQRDPDLEMQAARAMISHQVDCLIATGATDPDRIADLCAASGVRAINLDLPGSRAPSVISDNYGGALVLTRQLLGRLGGAPSHLLFIGGRAADHNTAERIRGFCDAHAEIGISPPQPELILPCGYAAEKAQSALDRLVADGKPVPPGFFVNSTIALEGVMAWLHRRHDGAPPHIGCFDWDPIIAAVHGDIPMIRQDVPAMLTALFQMIDASATDVHDPGRWLIQIPTVPELTGRQSG